jgi:hypothetical protein
MGTFDRQALEAEVGFFYFVIAGMLFAGAAIWLFGLLLPYVWPGSTTTNTQSTPEEIVLPNTYTEDDPETEDRSSLDRQMVYQDIRDRFGREDILDLMFDLEINESDVLPLDQDMNQLIINIIDSAEKNNKSDQLALAVERILTPPPPEHLPRLERITADSPPTILRQYILANYSLEELRDLAIKFGCDWEQLDAGAKREKTRSLLQYAYRRNRIAELVDLMQEQNEIQTI